MTSISTGREANTEKAMLDEGKGSVGDKSTGERD